MITMAFHIVHACIGNAGNFKPRNYLVRRKCREDANNDLFEGLTVQRSLCSARELWICGQLWHLEHPFTKDRPLSLILNAEHDGPPVSRLKRPVRINASMRSASTGRWWGAIVRIVERKAHPFDHAFKHGDVKPTTLACLATLYQSSHDVAVRIHPCCDICYGVACLCWLLFRPCGREEASFALYQQVVGFFVTVGAV